MTGNFRGIAYVPIDRGQFRNGRTVRSQLAFKAVARAESGTAWPIRKCGKIEESCDRDAN
jgi:hypothetical protein